MWVGEGVEFIDGDFDVGDVCEVVECVGEDEYCVWWDVVGSCKSVEFLVVDDFG